MNRKLKITAALLLSSGSVVVSRATNWRRGSGPASTASSSIDSRQKGGSRMRLAGFRLLLVTAALGVAGLAILVSGPGASGVRQNQSKLSPQAALDWNLIAVNTVRSATLTPTKFQPEGLLYMAYVQAAEYNAVMAISGRYAPYRSSLQAVPGASPRAAVAAAAYTTLSYYFPTLAPSLVSTYNDYLNVTLAKVPEKARLAGAGRGPHEVVGGQLVVLGRNGLQHDLEAALQIEPERRLPVRGRPGNRQEGHSGQRGQDDAQDDEMFAPVGHAQSGRVAVGSS